MDLFSLNLENNLEDKQPLASKMRPKRLKDFIGQKHLVGKGKYLERVIKSDRVPSIIFYGPPGVGKTTLAEIIAITTNKQFLRLSAVTSNLKELRETLATAEDSLKFENINSILFIDEIHRFNKTQQDALLPFVEKGIITLIGATTENPYFEVNRALISRCQILNLNPLSVDEIEELIRATLKKEKAFNGLNLEIDEEAIKFLAEVCSGDARLALNSLEIAVFSTDSVDGIVHVTVEDVENCIQKKNLVYDKNGNNHYDVISAFIKSVRGSDPDAAIFYLAKMLESGEDPKFIARRLIILASEDISNADPMGLVLANAAFDAVNVIGMPECRINLAQVTTYLACAPKSNAAYLAINEALEDVKKGNYSVPMHLRDRHSPNIDESKKYMYPHNYPNGYVEQRYLPEEINKIYYRPTEHGYEEKFNRFLSKIRHYK
ncbi:replication-associated recombination protein A [Peptoniphilus indolicus]|uniref:Replication-associated recombination protein A n=2 Tax=Peptoniphilus indolicus TaxID=33030 RepID=G4D483_9FIRM|nr:replication-associated recombination protein A [Peptoniphilus indolicus]EGY79688.1 replication-associated recombination protein A [Peptoniphilus indolicus ATCC 29427]SUB75902.1 Replication-associated recombination protein A [Peptoniphilus indolicus]